MAGVHGWISTLHPLPVFSNGKPGCKCHISNINSYPRSKWATNRCSQLFLAFKHLCMCSQPCLRWQKQEVFLASKEGWYPSLTSYRETTSQPAFKMNTPRHMKVKDESFSLPGRGAELNWKILFIPPVCLRGIRFVYNWFKLREGGRGFFCSGKAKIFLLMEGMIEFI